MKKISIVVAGLFILAACNNETKDAGSKIKYVDRTIDGLKGEVTAVEETPYKTDSSGKPGTMDSCCIDWWQYDENGNFIKAVSKDSKGTVKSETTAERYEDGLWKSQKTLKEGKPSGSFETKVDEKGNYTSVKEYDSTGKLKFSYTGITQNEFGQATGWKQYDKDSVFRQEGEAKFDKNLQTGFTLKDSTGKVKSTSADKYNDKGEMTEESNTTITKDSTTTKVTKYIYESHDDTGNWTQRTTWDDKGKATKIIKRAYTYKKKEEEKK
jgi:predicted small secreted protein